MWKCWKKWTKFQVVLNPLHDLLFLSSYIKMDMKEKKKTPEKHLKSHLLYSQTKRQIWFDTIWTEWCIKYLHWEVKENGQSDQPFSLFGITNVDLAEVWQEESWPHLFFIQPLSISERSSMKKDLFVFAVWNLISALQPPHRLPHVLGLQWWCVAPLFANIQCCKNKVG